MTEIVRPRAAAGLVLLRGRLDAPEVLLGRRRDSAGFMPGVYVTPGGVLERRDATPSGFPEPLPPQPPGLDRDTARRRHAFARCAFREAFEEAGVLVGDSLSDACAGVGPAAAGPAAAAAAMPWCNYTSAGLAPGFPRLRLACRAITPAGCPKRFHTRFFVCEARDAVRLHDGDGELANVGWFAWDKLAELPMADVTPLVLDSARRLRAALAEGWTPPAERIAWRGMRRLPG